nr:DUF484 family protein [Phenylobacterium sp.]
MRAWLQAHPQTLLDDRSLLEEIGLKPHGRNVVEFGRAALDLMEARNLSDLARRLDGAAQGRFGLAGAAVALEKPGPVPFGWRALEAGGVDKLLGEHGLTWLGPNFDGLGLFGAAEAEVRSVALIRMAPAFPGADSARPALCAFGSPEEDGFTPTMGCELVAFIARVVERMAERWPLLG